MEEARKFERHLAYHDNLTGLPNRQLFYDRLNHAVAHAKRHGYLLGVFFLDLDGFKQINDSLGHEIGDLLLKEVAQRLQGCVRESDTVARLSGDEFTVILENISRKQDAATIAEKILKKLSEPIVLDGNEPIISTSIGISLFPNDGNDTKTLLKQADTAMYRVKCNEKNHYRFYNESMDSEDIERLELENDLRKAIDNDELLLHYQPQLDLKKNEIVGVEALVRWQHPELGLLPPAKFISLAEESGLIVPLGEWVLRTACRQNKTWQQMGLAPVRIAVNLSARQFRVSRLQEIINQILKESRLEPNYLVLEITETSAMQNINYTIKTLAALKEMDIQLSIDDFCTGYASLNYLKRLPFDILKVDRSFVNGLDDNDDWAIVSAIVTMAHSMKMKVLAEGVEKQEQLKYLQLLNCDEVQGFYFSRPVPADSITEMLRSGMVLN